jgi:AraC-like DNA-binding protein
MDALSDVLRAVRLTGAVFFDLRAAEPWVAATPASRAFAKRIFPGAEHVIPYHLITRGGGFISVDGAAAVAVTAGDIVVVAHGEPHVLSSAPGMPGKTNLALYRRPVDQALPFTIEMGAHAGEVTEIVCGYLACDARPYNPLLDALPQLVKVGRLQGGDLETYTRFARAESGHSRLGGECVLGLLSELMFVDVIRRYLETLPLERMNWLAGLRDPYVGRALAALHADPARAWTLQALGRTAGLSRSALAERFAQFVGRPPMQYLAMWRMQLAAGHLRSGIDNVATIASRVGYESEAAFSRAFKKAVGVPPKAWREQGSTLRPR